MINMSFFRLRVMDTNAYAVWIYLGSLFYRISRYGKLPAERAFELSKRNFFYQILNSTTSRYRNGYELREIKTDRVKKISLLDTR